MELYTVSEAAAKLKIAVRTLRKYLQEGQIEGVAYGGSGKGRRWRISQEGINKFIEKRTQGGE